MPLSTPSLPAPVSDGRRVRSVHPLHAFLLAGSVPLFLGVLLSDFTYFSSHEVQWKNFASWLIIGGLIFGGFALLWALVELFRADQDRGDDPLFILFCCSPPGFSASSTNWFTPKTLGRACRKPSSYP